MRFVGHLKFFTTVSGRAYYSSTDVDPILNYLKEHLPVKLT